MTMRPARSVFWIPNLKSCRMSKKRCCWTQPDKTMIQFEPRHVLAVATVSTSTLSGGNAHRSQAESSAMPRAVLMDTN